MEWLRREDRGTCQECWEEANNMNIPPLKRIQFIEQYPCSRHGHPGILPRKLNAWVHFFWIIKPYCTPQTLPVDLIGRFCDEYEIKFTDAFEHLTTILKAFAVTPRDVIDANRIADNGSQTSTGDTQQES